MEHPTAVFILNRRRQRLLVHAFLPKHPVGTAVVLCPPFGEEKQKSYRAHLCLARALARKGIGTYRFDYSGCGDSEGDFADTTIETMIDDTFDVVAHAMDESSPDQLFIAGTRLGATIAALSAERGTQPDGLGLLFPILDGARYWRELVRQQQFADLSTGLKPVPRTQMTEMLETRGFVEIESNLVSGTMVRQLTKIGLTTQDQRIQCKVFTSYFDRQASEKTDVRMFGDKLKSSSCSVTDFASSDKEYWTLNSLYSNYQPTNTFDRFIEWIQS